MENVGMCKTIEVRLLFAEKADRKTNCRWVGYTKVWNFLDYSALAFPVSTVSREKDGFDESYVPRNALDDWNHRIYDPESMHGLPVGLQIIGRRLEEEKVLAAAKVIEDVLETVKSRH